MSYTYDLIGKLSVSPPLSPAQVAYLQEFSHSYRHKFAPQWQSWPNPLREAVGLPVGIDGAYISSAMGTGADFLDNCFQVDTDPPDNQPSFQCCWTTNAQGSTVHWNKLQRTFAPVEWLNYLIAHFFEPWGVALNGVVQCHGEEEDDRSLIVVNKNLVRHTGKSEWDAFQAERTTQRQNRRLARRLEKTLTVDTPSAPKRKV